MASIAGIRLLAYKHPCGHIHGVLDMPDPPGQHPLIGERPVGPCSTDYIEIRLPTTETGTSTPLSMCAQCRYRYHGLPLCAGALLETYSADQIAALPKSLAEAKVKAEEGTDEVIQEFLGLKVSQFTGIMGDEPETEQDRAIAQVVATQHMAQIVAKLQQQANMRQDRRKEEAAS